MTLCKDQEGKLAAYFKNLSKKEIFDLVRSAKKIAGNKEQRKLEERRTHKQFFQIQEQLTNMRLWLRSNVQNQLGAKINNGYFEYRIWTLKRNKDGYQLRVWYKFHTHFPDHFFGKNYPSEYKKLEKLSTRISGEKYCNKDIYFSFDNDTTDGAKMRLEIEIDITVPNSILTASLINRHNKLVRLSKNALQLRRIFYKQLPGRNLDWDHLFSKKASLVLDNMSKLIHETGGRDGLDSLFTSYFADVITFLSGDPNPHTKFSSYHWECLPW
jgi:hypothetical protein